MKKTLFLMCMLFSGGAVVAQTSAPVPQQGATKRLPLPSQSPSPISPKADLKGSVAYPAPRHYDDAHGLIIPPATLYPRGRSSEVIRRAEISLFNLKEADNILERMTGLVQQIDELTSQEIPSAYEAGDKDGQENARMKIKLFIQIIDQQSASFDQIKTRRDKPFYPEERWTDVDLEPFKVDSVSLRLDTLSYLPENAAAEVPVIRKAAETLWQNRASIGAFESRIQVQMEKTKLEGLEPEPSEALPPAMTGGSSPKTIEEISPRQDPPQAVRELLK